MSDGPRHFIVGLVGGLVIGVLSTLAYGGII